MSEVSRSPETGPWPETGGDGHPGSALTACGSSASGSGAGAGGGGGQSAAKGATLTVADVAPFTGTDAALGPTYLVSCDAATNAINADGGVLGHKFACKSVDTRGDPADAVPAVRQMYASTSNLGLVIGCTSDEAASVVPVFGANKTVSFCMTGQSEFDHVKFPYFYRLVPPDLSESYAMVAIAKHQGYKRIALAFGNDIGSQTFVKPAIAAIKKAGMSLVANQTLDLSANTFRTEAARIVAAKPDVILTEALGPDRGVVPVRGQAAQRRQADSRDRHLGHDLAGLVQVGVGLDRRGRAGPELLGRQPGRGDLGPGVPGRSRRRSTPRRARSDRPATSRPT